MPNVYIVMGQAKTGKSTTIKTLTGVLKAKVIKVATLFGEIDIFVRVTSLQEAGISPQYFIQVAKTKGYDNILIALRIKNESVSDGLDYIKDFKLAKWNICGIAVLQNPSFAKELRTLNYPTKDISEQWPPNRIAREIRKDWRWL